MILPAMSFLAWLYPLPQRLTHPYSTPSLPPSLLDPCPPALQVINSTEVFLYLPNMKNSSDLLSGDHTIPAAGPYAPNDHFTNSFVADVPY